MPTRTPLLLILLFALFACRKSSKTDQPAIVEPVMKFDSCACSIDSKPLEEGYISAVIDGVQMCFDVSPSSLPDTFSHHMRYGYIGRDTGDQYFDNVYMIKNSTDGKWQIAFFLENTHALDREFPYNLPRPDPFYCEIGELQLISLEHFSSCESCPNANGYSYFSQFWTDYNVKMTVTGFNNQYFDGVFSGTIYSRMAKPAKIANGKFHVKLITYEQYIQL